MRNIAIDFDNVICDPDNVDPGYKMGNPIPGAREALIQLRRHFKVIIFTVRGDRLYLREWLEYYKIPFDDITDKKPNTDYYIDDKAIKFTNWPEVLKEIK